MAVRAAMDGTGAELAVFTSPAAMAHFQARGAAFVITASAAHAVACPSEIVIGAGQAVGCEGRLPAGLAGGPPDTVVDLTPHLVWRVSRSSGPR